MIDQYKRSPIAAAIGLVVGVTSMSQVALAQAQQQPAAQKQERIEVTGSNIKRTDVEGVIPIQVITAEDIRKSGKQTITDILRELPSNAAGGLTELTGSASFSAGAASASLRGLGSGATLVLLNGRRIAPYGLVDPNFGQSAVVNLNALPLDVIERIEILKDGASAIYGSEAIAGVINIILRKDFKGGQVGLAHNTSTRGLFKSTSATLTYGLGDLGRDKYNIFGNLEVFKTGQVMAKDVQPYLFNQRMFDVYGTFQATSSYHPQLSYLAAGAGGTTVFTPGAGCPAADRQEAQPILLGNNRGTLCLYDQWKHIVIAPEQNRVNAFLRGTVELPADMTAFAEASVNTTEVYFPGAPRVVGQGVGNWFVANTGGLNRMPTQLPVGHPNNPTTAPIFYRWRANTIGDQNTTQDSTATRLLVGLKGTNLGWDWETSILDSRSVTKSKQENELRGSVLINGVANRTLNFLDPNIASILGVTTNSEAKSGFTTFEVKGSRELFKLPGGNASVAAGIEYRNEMRQARPDPLIPAGEIVGRGVAQADAKRNVSTAYGELVLPVYRSLELQLAARSEKYSDTGNTSFTPKFSASWKPMDSIKFRGSYAEGYRAPSLTESAQSSTSGFFNGVDDPRRCLRPTITTGCGLSIPGLIVASPFLRPETAVSRTLGIVLEPTRDFSITADYFDIQRSNEITFLSLNEILLNEGSTDPRYANKIVRDPTNTNSGVPNDPGAILFVRTGFDNLGRTTAKGWDFDVRYKFSTQTAGKFDFRLAATYYTDQSGSGAPGAPMQNFNGFRNAPSVRANFTANWELSNFVYTGTINHLGRHSTFSNPENLTAGNRAAALACADSTGSYLGYCEMGRYTTLDLGVTYRGIKDLRLGLVVRNVMDQLPPADPLSRPLNFVWYSPAGRAVNLSARYTF